MTLRLLTERFCICEPSCKGAPPRSVRETSTLGRKCIWTGAASVADSWLGFGKRTGRVKAIQQMADNHAARCYIRVTHAMPQNKNACTQQELRSSDILGNPLVVMTYLQYEVTSRWGWAKMGRPGHDELLTELR